MVNSYKRLIVGYEAPVYVTWARNNRSALVRVPVTKAGKQTSTRIEYRSPDPACNPYLAFSVMLAAGLRGISEGYELPPEAVGQRLRAHPRGAGGRGHRVAAPSRSAEALDVMESSELVAECLGEHIFEWFLRNKRAEWADYKSQVTQFELDRYLGTTVIGPMEPLLLFPDPAPPELAQALDLGGYPWKAVADESAANAGRARRRLGRRHHLRRRRPRGRLRPVPGAAQARPAPRAGARCSSRAPSSATSSCARTCSTTSAWRRSTPASSRPGSSTCSGAPGGAPGPSWSSTATSSLNLETYQAAISGRPLDLTYMEYELLKFLSSHPGKVFTRETLLSRVWGYEYYGGARTVDVHVRRLRAKLGEEHANLIQTVRSVGYRFGQNRTAAE